MLIATENPVSKKVLKTKTAVDKQNYISFRNNLKFRLRKAERQFYAQEFGKRRSNTKATWSLINQILHKLPGSNNVDFLSVANQIITAPHDIADAVNNYFATIGSKLASTVPPATTPFTSYLPAHVPSSAVFLPTTPFEILDVISNLESSSTCANDEIPMTVIKSVADIIAIPLSIVINHSIHTATFPDALKLLKLYLSINLVQSLIHQTIDPLLCSITFPKYTKKLFTTECSTL